MDSEFRRRSVPQFSSRRWRYGKMANAVARRRHNPVVRLLRRAALGWLDATDNVQFSIATDGEAWLLRRLASVGCSVILDVGSNLGDWAITAATALPGATVHCFELDDETRALLSDRLPSQRFVIAPAGLDQHSGEVEYDYYPDEPALTSLVPVPHSLPATRRSGSVSTGDTYIRETGLDRVDVVKIDVEGAEGRVLAGFAGTLGRQAIRVVQFEYGLANVTSRTLLADLYELMEGHGYTVGRLFPDGVEFRPFDVTAESFRGGNFVAVARADHEALAALRATHPRSAP